MSCVATLIGHKRSINYVAFNPTGTLIATASNDNTAKLWLTSSATCVATLEVEIVLIMLCLIQLEPFWQPLVIIM